MRLAQLARKLDVRQTDIVAFLEGKNIDVTKGSNFRLDEPTIALILQQFGPLPGTVDMDPPEPAPEYIAPETDEPISQEEPPMQAPEITETHDQAPAENVELIRAPKVELPGLRVVGKIDLPDPRRKAAEGEGDDAATHVEREKAPVPRKKRRTPATADTRNTSSLRREREARAAERKRRAEEELAKERRRQKYLNKVKINVPTRPARIYDEEVEELQPDLPEEKRSSLWGRFIGWLFRKG